MKRTTRLATMLAIGSALALPASAAAQTPTQDSVQASGETSFFGHVAVSAQSGPSGENPSGTVEFLGGTGPVDCLQVSGNTAFVRFVVPTVFGSTPLTAKLIDGGPAGSGLDRFTAFFSLPASTDCGFQPFGDYPLTGGDIVVVDASPLPTSKDQCKNGGWRSFGTFKNQGDCVSFVATGGKNPPGA
jgi:hypothetical protein